MGVWRPEDCMWRGTDEMGLTGCWGGWGCHFCNCGAGGGADARTGVEVAVIEREVEVDADVEAAAGGLSESSGSR
jgi:hypothetical protein